MQVTKIAMIALKNILLQVASDIYSSLWRMFGELLLYPLVWAPLS